MRTALIAFSSAAAGSILGVYLFFRWISRALDGTA
jgi:hypothetical protein